MNKIQHGGDRHIPSIHEMRLDDEPFYMIKNALKTVELRLYDEKRKSIRLGDFIRFFHKDTNEMILARVNATYTAPSFLVLFEIGGLLKKCGWERLSPNEAAQIIRKYYTASDEEQNGAVGIEFTVIIKEPTETPIISL